MTEAEINAAVERIEQMLDSATQAAKREEWQVAILYLQEAHKIATTLPTKPGHISPSAAIGASIEDLIVRRGGA